MNTNSTFTLASVHLIPVALLAAAIPFLSGCKTMKPIALTLDIKPIGQAASLTIPVYIGAANQTYEKELMEESVDNILERFRSTFSIYSTKIKSFQLAAGGTNISRLDPIWSIWLGQNRDHVVVIADLPKNFLPKNFGREDPRRVAIPLGKRLWRHLPSKNKKTVHVEIHEEGVKRIDTPGF